MIENIKSIGHVIQNNKEDKVDFFTTCSKRKLRRGAELG